MIFRFNHTDPVWWRGPSPMRAGYIRLLSCFMGSQGPQNITVGIHLSAVFCALNLLLLAWLGLGLLGPQATLIALLLMLASPLDLLIARRAWMDGVFANAILLLIWAAHAVLTNARFSLWRALGLAAACTWLCLLKESGPLFCLLVGTWLMALRWLRHGTPVAAAAPAALMALGIAAAVGIQVHLAGGWEETTLAWGHSFETFSEDYVQPDKPSHPVIGMFAGVPLIDDPEGHRRSPWYGCLAGLWALSPAVLLLGLAGTGLVLRAWFRDRRNALGNPEALGRGALAWILLSFLVLASLQPKTLRWLAPLDVPLHALAGLAAWRLAAIASARWKRLTPGPTLALALGLAAAVAWADYGNYLAMKAAGVSDPTIPSVTSHSAYPAPRVTPPAVPQKANPPST